MSKGPKASLSWRHLPSDKSMNQVCMEYKEKTNRDKRPSITWVQNVLSELDVKTTEDSIYYALYGEKKQREKNDVGTTHLISISWEAEKLIHAVFSVRDGSSKSENITARHVLQHVAKELVDKAEEQYKDLFIRYTIFENTGIQQALLHSFRPIFQKRMAKLEEYLFSPEQQIDINKLNRALEQIDVLLCEFRRTLPLRRSDDPQQLNLLYHKLNAPRNALLKNISHDSAKIENYCWSSNADQNLINDLQQQISTTSRFPDQSEADAFLKNYRKYLETTALPEMKISNFERRYQELHQYFYGVSSVEQFRQEITVELHHFARSIFENLRYLDTIEISCTGYQQQYVTSAYARYVLADVHRDIQMILHASLIPLRATYSYGFFTGFSEDCTLYEMDKIEQVYGVMRNEINVLSEKYPVVQNGNWEQAYELYKIHAEPIFGEDMTPKAMIRQAYYGIDLQENAVPKKLYAMSELLRMTCQIVVAIEVEKAIERLTKEYSEMLGMLSE